MKKQFEMQKMLQAQMGFPMGQGIEAIKENALALIVEVTEALNETDWKLWQASGEYGRYDKEKLVHELADIQQFLFNIVAAAECSYEEFGQLVTQLEKVNAWG